MSHAESSFEIMDDDRIWEQLKAKLEDAYGSFAKAGVVGDKATEPEAGSEFNVVDLAVVHEFGATINHPGNNFIVVNGLARSVPAGTPGIVGQTPPHKIEIPERSFIRSTFDQLRSEYEDRMRDFAGWIYDGKITVERALGLMGQLVAKDVRQQIRSSIKPELAASTLRRKLKKTRPGSTGSPVSLIDTGQLLNSISYAVVLKGGAASAPSSPGSSSGQTGGGDAGGGAASQSTSAGPSASGGRRRDAQGRFIGGGG